MAKKDLDLLPELEINRSHRFEVIATVRVVFKEGQTVRGYTYLKKTIGVGGMPGLGTEIPILTTGRAPLVLCIGRVRQFENGKVVVGCGSIFRAKRPHYDAAVRYLQERGFAVAQADDADISLMAWANVDAGIVLN